VRWPQLGYVTTGALASALLALLFPSIAALRLSASSLPLETAPSHAAAVAPAAESPLHQQPGTHLPALLGIAFIAYYSVRWLIAGTPSIGNDEFGTIIQCAAWAGATALLFSCADAPLRARLTQHFLRLLALLALACGLQAIAQYAWLYDRSYSDLLTSLHGTPPDPMQTALLHHFQLKRVASVWGDPNILAGFSAISCIAAIALLRVPKSTNRLAVDSVLGGASLLGSIASVLLSGSRGGLLELILVATGAVTILLRRRRAASITLLLTALCVALVVTRPAQAQPSNSTTTAWTWRSNTIQERGNYATVGVRMFRTAPLCGLGVGSVDLYFGRFKPPEARETKYLHNWALQLLAETGAVGLLLAVSFLAALFYAALKRQPRSPHQQAVTAMAALFVIDALMQLSFNHREMMALFGILCGVLIGNTSGPVLPRTSTRFLPLIFSLVCSAAILTLVTPRLLAHSYRLASSDALEANDQPQATQLLRESQKWEPGNPATYLQLASIEEAAGQLSAARMLQQKAVSLQPESAAAHAALARTLQRLSDYPAAERELNEALRRYPANPAYNGQMAQLLIAAHRTSEALTFAGKAARYSPGVPGAEQWPAFYSDLQRGVK
jgi:tetratricopeptide (TPR) repeat protein